MSPAPVLVLRSTRTEVALLPAVATSFFPSPSKSHKQRSYNPLSASKSICALSDDVAKGLVPPYDNRNCGRVYPDKPEVRFVTETVSKVAPSGKIGRASCRERV